MILSTGCGRWGWGWGRVLTQFLVMFNDSLLCFAQVDLSRFGHSTDLLLHIFIHTFCHQLFELLRFGELQFLCLNGRIWNIPKKKAVLVCGKNNINKICAVVIRNGDSTERRYANENIKKYNLLGLRVNALPFCFSFWLGTLAFSFVFPWAILCV